MRFFAHPGLTRRQLAVALACISDAAQAQSPTEPDEGIDYETLPVPQPVAHANRIEVLEFFRYGCPFCNRMEEHLHSWLPRLPADVVFRKVPVSFHSTTHQQLHLTLEALGEAERLGPRMFETIHRHGHPMEMLMEISAWAEQHGLAATRFEAAWHSSAVQLAMARCNAQVKAWGVSSVPQFGVQGRCITSPTRVGGSYARALEVVDWLVAKERQRNVLASSLCVTQTSRS